jgi:hypothetical protein
MAPPSKFRAAARARVLEILGAGGSRAQAARAAGIDPATLSRWVARGSRAAPGGRWRAFYEAVMTAEADPHLTPLRDPFEDPSSAWRYLDRSEFGPRSLPMSVDIDPSRVVVRFTDGTPVHPEDDA